MSKTNIDYIGDELEFFAEATNWKNYLRQALSPYLSGEVAEVGAGRGATTRVLAGVKSVTGWTAIEPDPDMADLLRQEQAAGDLLGVHEVHGGTLADLPAEPRFDTVIYIDVLEHIEDDRGETALAAARLRPGGRLVVLAPAWQTLFSPFDMAVGHFRRYTRETLRAVAPAGFYEEAAFYLDSVGLIASLANKLLLKQSMPRKRQIKTWDRLMVPVSKVLDRMILRSVGRSVVLVWRKSEG